MSFSQEVKNEILRRKISKPCCNMAAAYAVACFGKYFDDRGVVLQTENEGVAHFAQKLYRRCGGNEDFFAVSPGDYDGGLVQADMTMSQVRYRRALSQAEEVQEITPDTLTAGYPGLGQSVAQVIHNTDERCKSLQ